jgi:hypothetical protein
MNYNNTCCSPTYLVTAVNESGGTAYTLTFRTTPTLVNGSVIKFRITDGLSTVATAGLPILANVNVNGTLVSVPLLDSIGNNVRTGDDLRTRTTYTAVFGSDPNHLLIAKVKGKSCLGV